MNDVDFLQQMDNDFDDLDVDGTSILPAKSEPGYSEGSVYQFQDVQPSSVLGAASDIDDLLGYSDNLIVDVPDNDNSEDDINSLSNISAAFNFDMEDLSGDFGSTTADESTALATEMNELHARINKCGELGFSVPDQNNHELVDKVYSYAVSCTQEVDFLQLFGGYYGAMSMKLINSQSLSVAQGASMQAFKAKILKCVNDPTLQDACAKIINEVCNRVLILRQTKSATELRESDIDADEIWQLILANKTLSKYPIVNNSVKLMNFITTVIHSVLENEVAMQVANENDESRRKSVAYTLTDSVYNTIMSLSKSNTAYIKHIRASNGGKVMCTCGKCGKEVSVGPLMMFVFFLDNSSASPYVFPTENRCECGSMLVFPAMTYKTALNYFTSSNKKSLSNAIERAKRFGPGSAVVSITPALSQLPPEIQCIVDDTDEVSNSTSKMTVEVFDSVEWQQAVDDFYNRIKLLDSKRVSHVVPGGMHTEQEQLVVSDECSARKQAAFYDGVNQYHAPKSNTHASGSRIVSILAANVAQVVGVNYNTVKEKAMLTLLNFLHSNQLLQIRANFDNVLGAHASLKLVMQYNDTAKFDLNRLDSHVFANLMAIAGRLDSHVSVGDDKNEIQEFFHNHMNELQDYVNDMDSSYAEFIANVELSKYALACLPITDHVQASVYAIAQMIPDERVFNLFNEICDRMIINNYAEEYFEFWKRHMPKLANRAAKKLTNISDVTAIKSFLRDSMSASLFSRASDKYFENIVVKSLSHFELLRELVTIAERGNYYQFCRHILSLGDNSYGFGSALDSCILEFRDSNYAEFSSVLGVTEVQYYLGEMFTPEEISDNAEIFDYLVFGRYLPVRYSDETPEQYVSRFKFTAANDCIDNMEKFLKLKNIECIYFCSVITGAEYKNFRIANLMAYMMDSVIESNDTSALDVIGISDLRMSMLNTIETWDFSKFNINNADAMALLNSYYFTDADIAIVDTFSEMSETYFTVNGKNEKLSDVFDFDERLLANLKKVAADPDNSDIAAMAEELRTWQFSDKYAERFIE